MRVLIQRVSQASVTVDDEIVGSIQKGLLVFLGVGENDTPKDADWLVEKISSLRIFGDSEGKMNLSLLDTGGEALVVSQFTLYGDCRKGRRPSFDKAAAPALADTLYEYFKGALAAKNIKVAAGRFAADMKVSLINDGPVTFIIDSPEK